MEITIKSSVLFTTVVLTGLSAGFFYAWQVSVIPGTKKVMDLTYLETMQSINRAILNPAFFLIFFGTLISLGMASIFEFQTNRLVFGLVLASAITYLTGTFGVTAFGNVPLNNELEAMNISEVANQKITDFRHYYEVKWNRLHMTRTVFSVLSFLLAMAAVFAQIKSN